MNNQIKIENCPGVYPGGPETIALAQTAFEQGCQSCLDFGTGNGYIAIYLSRRNIKIEALDISQKAVQCARENARLNNCQFKIFQSDLFSQVKNKYDCITFIPPINANEKEYQRTMKSLVRSFPLLIKLTRPLIYSITRKSRIKLVNKFISQAKNYLNPAGQVLISLPTNDIEYINRKGISFKAITQPTKLTTIYQIKYRGSDPQEGSTLMDKKRFLCLTLDLEKDYGYFETYRAFENIDLLLDLIKKYDLKITVFLVGSLIKQKKDIIEKFKSVPVEFALHSYSHDIKNKNPDFKSLEVIKAKAAYFNYFDQPPFGYRAPQGAISQAEIEELVRQGFKYDCSIFPYWRPGLYNNLKIPTKPFCLPSGLLEIPLSVLPIIRLPISLSYIQFFGWNFYKLFLRLFGWSSLIVFDFHLHNLRKARSLKGAPFYARLFYLRNQNKGFQILEEFIKLVKNKGYQSIFLSQLASKYE